jgi:hypothetical protein
MESSGEGSKEGDEFNELQDYAILLMPFYDKNPGIPLFFEKLLKSKDGWLRLNAAVLLIRHGKPVPDSLLNALAASDRFRAPLYKKLEAVRQESRFPAAFRSQQFISRSELLTGRTTEFFAIASEGRQWVHYRAYSGWAYFFRYKMNREDDWRIAICGLQPAESEALNMESELVRLSGRKIKTDQPLSGQFNEELKRMIFSKYKSAGSFYLENGYYGPPREMED